jgi:hypothetical protein
VAKLRDLRGFLNQPLAEIVQCGEPKDWHPDDLSSSRGAPKLQIMLVACPRNQVKSRAYGIRRKPFFVPSNIYLTVRKNPVNRGGCVLIPAGPFSFQNAVEYWQLAYEDRLTAAVRALLEDHHLYQSVVIKHEDLMSDLLPKVTPDLHRGYFVNGVRDLRAANWGVRDPANQKEIAGYRPIRLTIHDAKLFCNQDKCKRIEAFNVVSVESFLRGERLYPRRMQAQNSSRRLSSRPSANRASACPKCF